MTAFSDWLSAFSSAEAEPESEAKTKSGFAASKLVCMRKKLRAESC